MNKVLDLNGQEVRGLYRGSHGSLIVNDRTLLTKYNIERSARVRDKETISNLESEVESLKALVSQLIEKVK